jgi:hypothetical protein
MTVALGWDGRVVLSCHQLAAGQAGHLTAVQG